MPAMDSKTSSVENPGDQVPQLATTNAESCRNGNQSIEIDDLLQQIEALKNRLSKLSEASRQVSANLDVNSVLQEVIDNARYLTGARYGALLTYTQSGDIQDFITSGLSSDETRLLTTSPQGRGLLGHMNEIREPLRLADIASHPSSVGFPDNHPPMKTFLGMAIRHQGEHVGNIYLTEKDGGREFTSEDQEILLMFASHGGAAILNARRHREERQARANLEAVLALAPVGVLVVNAETRKVESVNREGERIIGVRAGVSLEEFRDRASYSLPDGHGLPIERHPIQAALRGMDAIQAEEVVFESPGGQKTSCLINAKAIRSEQGELVSAVGTLLDITHLETLKRQRAQFLNNVSHKLRTPLTAIKGSTSTILGSSPQLSPAEIRQFLLVIDEQSDHMRHLINDLVDISQIEAGLLSVNPKPVDLADILDQAIEEHIHSGPFDNRVIELDFPEDIPKVMADKTRIVQALDNLLAEAFDLSPEQPTIKISAFPSDGHVAVTVDHEGAGPTALLPPHHLKALSRTEDRITSNGKEINDLAFGVSKGIIEAHGGRLTTEKVDSVRGGRFAFTIPVARPNEQGDEEGASRSLNFNTHKHEGGGVLAVTDDSETSRYIRNALSKAGLTEVRTCSTHEAELFIEVADPRVVLVEPELPLDSGFELLQRIERSTDARLILVAGLGWEQHIGRAFELGAFDYIAKPFTSTELVARTELAIRRGAADDTRGASGSFALGDLLINFSERMVTVAGQPVHLTATEYKLLTELSLAAGRVLSHEQLLRRVWGPLYQYDQRIVRTYVKELRHKLGDDAKRPTYIFNEPGVGYRMAKQLRV